MRLVECKILRGDTWSDVTLDLDQISHIESIIMPESCHIHTAFYTLLTDIPYKKAVDLWENYRINKGVSTTMD